jgi:hypothetical protein
LEGETHAERVVDKDTERRRGRGTGKAERTGEVDIGVQLVLDWSSLLLLTIRLCHFNHDPCHLVSFVLPFRDSCLPPPVCVPFANATIATVLFVIATMVHPTIAVATTILIATIVTPLLRISARGIV